MYLTIHNIDKIIQTHWTNPVWIVKIVTERDKYTIHLSIHPNSTTLHIIQLMRKQNQLLHTYELIIDGKYNEDMPHRIVKDKKYFVKWILNQLMYHYPVSR